MANCNAPYESKAGRCDAEATYPDNRCGQHTDYDTTSSSSKEPQPYSDSHVGETPVSWPNTRIGEHPDMWGADELVTDITKCRACSHDHGLCRRHRGMMMGYNDAVSDMTRAFNITSSDYPAELLEKDK